MTTTFKKIFDLIAVFIMFLVACCLWLAVFCIVVFVVPFLLMMLWNWLAPVFWAAAPHLTIFQAFGVWMLLSIIGGILSPSQTKSQQQ